MERLPSEVVSRIMQFSGPVGSARLGSTSYDNFVTYRGSRKSLDKYFFSFDTIEVTFAEALRLIQSPFWKALRLDTLMVNTFLIDWRLVVKGRMNKEYLLFDGLIDIFLEGSEGEYNNRETTRYETKYFFDNRRISGPASLKVSYITLQEPDMFDVDEDEDEDVLIPEAEQMVEEDIYYVYFKNNKLDGVQIRLPNMTGEDEFFRYVNGGFVESYTTTSPENRLLELVDEIGSLASVDDVKRTKVEEDILALIEKRKKDFYESEQRTKERFSFLVYDHLIAFGVRANTVETTITVSKIYDCSNVLDRIYLDNSLDIPFPNLAIGYLFGTNSDPFLEEEELRGYLSDSVYPVSSSVTLLDRYLFSFLQAEQGDYDLISIQQVKEQVFQPYSNFLNPNQRQFDSQDDVSLIRDYTVIE